MKIGLVTDSTSDLPPEVVARFGIEVVPAVLIIQEESFLDGEGLSREEFYAQLPGMPSPPTTAAPSVGSFTERYERLLGQGARKILSIHAAAALSGIFNAARLASEAFDGRVLVLDSGQISLGLGFQVLAAAEAAAEQAGEQEALARIQRTRQGAHVFALLDTLEYLRRSGRVSWARAALGGILRIKPMVELSEGQVINAGRARTRQQGVKLLLDTLRNVGPLERLAVLHTNAESDALEFLQEYSPPAGLEPLVVNVTTVIGTHVGPNGLGFAAVKQA